MQTAWSPRGTLRKVVCPVSWQSSSRTVLADAHSSIAAREASARRSHRSVIIGARRRTPVGKAFLGSVAQTLILEADAPVLVVQESR